MVLEIWYVCFDFVEKIAKQIEFALSCTYSVFTYFSKHITIQPVMEIYGENIRGKSWGTTFLPDWQPPLIFVWFTSKSREHYDTIHTIRAYAQEVWDKLEKD